MPPKRGKLRAPLTDEEKYQLKIQQEINMHRLKQECEILERNRNLAFGESHLAKGQRVIQVFQMEHRNILTDLAVATTPEKLKDDERTTSEVRSVLHNYSQLQDRVATRKVHMKEIEAEIRVVKKRVLELRSHQITDVLLEERAHRARVTVDTLENKLEVQIKKFCVICSKNVRLRAELNHLLYERELFMKMFRHTVNKLAMGKIIMLDLIEQATLAYDQREEWCMRLHALRVTARNECQNHAAQYKEYHKQYKNMVKLEEFIETKSQKRLMLDLARLERIKRERRKQKIDEKVNYYRSLVEEIRTLMPQKEMAQRYGRQESENFSVFKYTLEMILEMESVSDELGLKHLEIDSKNLLHDNRIVQQSNVMAELQEQLESATRDRETIEEELKQLGDYYDKTLAGIERLFHLVKCDLDPLLKLLTDNTRIKFYNVSLFVQILEKKVHRILLEASHKEGTLGETRRRPKDHERIFLRSNETRIFEVNEYVRTTPCPLCMEHEVVSDVIDSRQHAWSRDTVKMELKMRLELPNADAKVHTVSKCQLPKSRGIMQNRFR